LPRYDYRCTSCSHEFELVQSFKDAGSGNCPKCSSSSQRVFHAVPVIYKGSGFYTTDYGRAKAPLENAKESKESDSTSDSKTSDSKTSDSKTSGSNESSSPSENSSSSSSDSASKSTNSSAT